MNVMEDGELSIVISVILTLPRWNLFSSIFMFMEHYLHRWPWCRFGKFAERHQPSIDSQDIWDLGTMPSWILKRLFMCYKAKESYWPPISLPVLSTRALFHSSSISALTLSDPMLSSSTSIPRSSSFALSKFSAWECTTERLRNFEVVLVLRILDARQIFRQSG